MLQGRLVHFYLNESITTQDTYKDVYLKTHWVMTIKYFFQISGQLRFTIGILNGVSVLFEIYDYDFNQKLYSANLGFN